MKLKFALLSLTAALSVFSNSVLAKAEMTLRLGLEPSIDSPQGVGAKEMAKVADELSKGKIAIEFFPDQQLGTGPQMIEMVKKGELDIFQGGAGLYSSIEPRLNVFDIPYLFDSVEQAYKVLDSDFGKEILATLEPANLKGLSFWENGIRSVTSNVKPINTPEDLVGLKIRVMPANQVHVDLWQGVGAKPEPLPYGEIYGKLKSGELDAQEHPIAPIYTGKFYEVQKYLSLTQHMYGPLIQVMNLEKFNALPKETQDILLKASYAGAVKMRQFSNENAAKFIDDMKNKGMLVNEVDTTPFKAKMRPLVEKPYVEKNGDDWLKKINASIEADRKK
ncbi:TRAP transporter substrate-binding protein [Basfia succiniciproducens]|uniref:TRAP transporter substrate-binding protein n=1 Tax=Basfia succiniciproducens TaxID=653940 RepID=UPI003FCE1955